MRTLFKLATLACLCAAASCTKEGGEPPPEQPKPPVPPAEKLLTNATVIGTYLITKVERNATGQRSDVTDKWFQSYAGNCAKDDATQFKPDNSFVVIDGSTSCEESTNDTGTWAVLAQSKLRLDSDTAIVENFTETSLRIISPVYSTGQVQMIFTYTRQ